MATDHCVNLVSKNPILIIFSSADLDHIDVSGKTKAFIGITVANVSQLFSGLLEGKV